MKTSRFSEEQTAHALRQADGGTPVGGVCRQLGVSEATFYVWKKQYDELWLSELREIRQLRDANTWLKRLVTDLTLDKHILSEVLKKGVWSRHNGGSWLPRSSRPSRRALSVRVG